MALPLKQFVAVLFGQKPVYSKRTVNREKKICRILWFNVNNNATRTPVGRISNFSSEIGSFLALLRCVE